MRGLTLRSRHGELPASIQEVLEKRAERLQRKHEDLVGIDVVVDVPHKSHRKGNRCEVRITVKLPRLEPIVVRGNDQDKVEQGQNTIYAIDQAFDAMEQKLQRHKERPPRGRAEEPFAESAL